MIEDVEDCPQDPWVRSEFLLRAAPLRLGLAPDCRGRFDGQEREPGVEDLFDLPAEGLPVLTLDRELGVGAEKRLLADLGADPLGAHKTVGEVSLATVGTDPGAADESVPSSSQKTGGVNSNCNFVILSFPFWDAAQQIKHLTCPRGECGPK